MSESGKVRQPLNFRVVVCDQCPLGRLYVVPNTTVMTFSAVDCCDSGMTGEDMLEALASFHREQIRALVEQFNKPIPLRLGIIDV